MSDGTSGDGELEAMKKTESEMNAIADMLNSAEINTLMCEVILSFGLLMAENNGNIEQSCAGALYEWDI